MMSLVDYCASSDEEEEEEEDAEVREAQRSDKKPEPMNIERPRPNSPPRQSPSQKLEQPVCQQSRKGPSMEKLPDASFLLNSPSLPSHMLSSNDHSSRVTAAIAENASRKRPASGAASSFMQTKIPKGVVPRSRNAAAIGLLVPPQLSGRSNVVTEDIGKLFVKKPSSHPSE